ncbi:hypothetical protein CP533_6325 [Ophiocordyceps camponoti-saundersi (nom. inval.)]|nr:hypothetical protein CP533_6325 [Ophiocordyceps camponoti-saundersi (nom. inval.)]
MPRQILLNNRQRSIESVAWEESNFLLSLRHQVAAKKFRVWLWEQRESIEAVVRHQLGLRRHEACTVLPPDSWIQGGFNLCVLVRVDSRRVVFRCPMAHKLAEHHHPGTVDEKVGCEVAAYFTHVSKRSFFVRAYSAFRRWIHRFLRYPLLSNYRRNVSVPAIDTAYMLMEYIGPETGQMLSCTWPLHRHDTDRRARLYRGMSRIMLSLARIPQPRIGSFRFNTADGTISLSNRPLTCTMMLFENSGTPRTMQTGQLYQNTDGFVSDMLTLYDAHFLHDPHAVRNADDARERMTIRTLLRAVAHHFISTERRDGPFLLQLTDFHQSNVFVDDEWNVTCLMDLEWICALPADMLSVPYWLTGCSIDTIVDDEYATFDEARREFLLIMDEEAGNVPAEHGLCVTSVMRSVWESKGVWFWACLRSINAWLFVFEDHIGKRFGAGGDLVGELKLVSTFWREGVEGLVEAKVREEERYQAELLAVFDDGD